MERRISFAEGEYYHLYNRGVNKGKIFGDRSDYWRFMFLLYLCNSVTPVRVDNLLQNKQGLTLLETKNIIFLHERDDQLIDIGAYCLMPNHFHLLVRENSKEGVSKFMQKLLTAFVMYYNKKHTRTGGLFEGVFRAEHVTNDTYLKYLFAYIHLNPIKLFDSKWKENGIKDRAGAEKFLDTYDYSSYQSYSGNEKMENSIVNPQAFPKYFAQHRDFSRFIQDWLDYRREESL